MLKTLPKDIFLDCFELKIINLRSNQITWLPSGIFSHLKKLIKLDLSVNKIDTIRMDFFNGLNSLEILNMERNGLNLIEAGALRPLEQLKILNFSHNNLSEVPQIPIANNLTILDLSHNNITKFNDDFLHIIKISNGLRGLFLDDNPLVIECETCNFLYFVKKQFIRFPELKKITVPGLKTPLYKLGVTALCTGEFYMVLAVPFIIVAIGYLIVRLSCPPEIETANTTPDVEMQNGGDNQASTSRGNLEKSDITDDYDWRDVLFALESESWDELFETVRQPGIMDDPDYGKLVTKKKKDVVECQVIDEDVVVEKSTSNTEAIQQDKDSSDVYPYCTTVTIQVIDETK
uniref:LRRCT domain-containing protein n=1 Tax=Bracon brevicornis TaxID=1563983 RepID=A0A6V7K4Q1_9HYME